MRSLAGSTTSERTSDAAIARPVVGAARRGSERARFEESRREPTTARKIVQRPAPVNRERRTPSCAAFTNGHAAGSLISHQAVLRVASDCDGEEQARQKTLLTQQTAMATTNGNGTNERTKQTRAGRTLMLALAARCCVRRGGS